MMMDFNLNQIATTHFDGEGEKFVTIYLNDYRKFSSARQIALSSHIVVKKGNLQPVIPNERKSCAGNISSSGFFVSIRLKEGVSCSYDEALNLPQTIQRAARRTARPCNGDLT